MSRSGLLTEHREPLALLLWTLVRDVELLSSTPHDRRAHLFSAAAKGRRAHWLSLSAVEPEVSEAITLVIRALSPKSDSSPAEIADACALVSSWARGVGAAETAIAYSQAAALTAPKHAAYALLTGRDAQALGQHTRAITWFQRAVALTRRERDRLTYSAAQLALAEYAAAEGRIAGARRRGLRAYRSARRAGKAGRTHRARAAYFLFRLERSTNRAEAVRFARISTVLALRGAEVEAGVALDLAGHWLARRRTNVSGRLLDLLSANDGLAPAERFTAAVLRARAEAVAGAPGAARGALTDAFDLVPDSLPGNEERAVASFVQLARCAAQVGASDLLARAAKLALTHAPAERFKELREELARLERRVGLTPDAT